MDILHTRNARLVLGIIALLGIFSLVAQLYLILANRIASVPETIVRYFSFFTILTNILVAICATVLSIKPVSRWGKFFSRDTTLTAITIYITIVGLVYNIILRKLWAPQGLQQVVDELLHSVIPLLFISLWIAWVPKRQLQWHHIPAWLIYPAVYALFVFIRGEFSGFYPYPFMNVSMLGYSKVLINSGLLLIIFVVFSAIPVTIARIAK
ncbi:MAG: Pr6Pr family membrane protein [Flavipsychrobacter sp.]